MYVLLLCLLGLASTLPLALAAGRWRGAVVITAAGVALAGRVRRADRSGHRGPAGRGLPALGRAVVVAGGRAVRPAVPGAGPASAVPTAPVIAELLAAWCRSAVGAGIAVRVRRRRRRQPGRAGRVRRHPAGTHRARRAGQDRPRTARRGRPPHLDDRGAGGNRPADDSGHAGRRGQRLSAIGDTARAALTEMRRLLGVLREDADAGRRRSASAAGPAPAQRPARRGPRRHRRGTRLILTGRPVPLDPGVELAAYRIVQEALTNSPPARARRGGRRRAGVPADRAAAADPGQRPGIVGAAGGISGHGLLGMRERAAAVGGRLRTGPARPADSWSRRPCRSGRGNCD